MGMAEMAQCPVIPVADIDRGGVFAAIYGTLALLQPQERARVKGVIINKFRGDVALLRSGIEQIEALTGVPVLGVMPWLDVDLEDEDGVALQAGKYHRTDRRDIDIAVVHLPHIANFTDFNAPAAQPDVRVRYVRDPQALADADRSFSRAVKIPSAICAGCARAAWRTRSSRPGSARCRCWGSAAAIRCWAKPLSMRWSLALAPSPGWGAEDRDPLRPAQNHHPCRRPGSALPDWLADAAGLRVSGYEIHMGETRREAGCPPLLQLHKAGQAVDDGAISDDGPAFGTYLHGLFDSDAFTRALLNGLRQRKGLAPLDSAPSMPAIKPGSLIGWPRPCANISPSIKFTPSCANIRSPYADSGYRRARSGKSRHAEALIADAPQVLYIATSQIFDDEMAARIQHHRDGRPAHWRTAERWQQLDELITPAIAPAEAILLECITTMVTNLLFALGGDSDPDGWDYAAMEQAIDDEIGVLIAACQRCPAHVVLVTNEVGMGIVPENRPARHFRDIAGRVNQRPAAAADAVWLVVSGIGVKIK